MCFQTIAQIDLTPRVRVENNETVFIWNLEQTKILAKIIVENKSNIEEIKLLDQLVTMQDSTIRDLNKINLKLKEIDINRENQLKLNDIKYMEISSGLNKCETDIKQVSADLYKKDKNYRRYRKASLIVGGILVGIILVK
jgi:hypothetical protein